jgi:hypothetical protein
VTRWESSALRALVGPLTGWQVQVGFATFDYLVTVTFFSKRRLGERGVLGGLVAVLKGWRAKERSANPGSFL